MKFRVLSRAAFALAAAAALSGCGGSSYGGSSTPTTPSPAPAPAGNTVTVTIVGSSGNKAYSPNPAQVNMGDTVAFKNADSTMHHVVMDDGSADLGNIAPGSTASMTLKTAGGNYHCTIHTSMVGSINGKDAPDPCMGQYCP
jgi:plastocyanin